MQHSKATKLFGGSAIDDQENEEESKKKESPRADSFNLPDYFGKFTSEASQIKNTNNQQSIWKNDCGNDNEENYKLIDQMVNNLVIYSDEDEHEKNNDKFEEPSLKDKINNNKIGIDAAKLKSSKPKNKIMIKNFQHNLNVAKLKSPKDAAFKGKLKKNSDQNEKPLIKNMASIAKIESKETVPNSSEETLETKIMEIPDFNKSGPFQFEQNLTQKFENAKLEDPLLKGKTKSQLSLKSKAYTRPGENIKNPQSNSHNSLDQMQKFSGDYHRHSMPQRSLEFGNNSYHYTPSTNFTILSSEEKRSTHGQMMNQNMSMHVFSPAPFENDFHNNSYDGTNPTDEAAYSNYPKEGQIPGNSYFSNTMPLPNMASFVPKVSYSPDV